MRLLGFTLLGLIMGSVFLWMGVRDILQGRSSKSWPGVEGVVRSCEVKQFQDSQTGRVGRLRFRTPGEISHRAVVQFRYEIEDENYYGKATLNDGNDSPSMLEVMALADRYEPGDPITVLYDPKNPEVSILEVGQNSGAWSGVLFGLALFGAGGVGVVLCWKRLNDDNYDHSGD